MQLVSDEPWSRPGDYVMLRAMNDLVCASSACPDDIDPSNAWEVTDVHVRVYPPENRFSMAIARRVTADAEPVLTRETAFHPPHIGADQELRRVPRLLAAPLLQQRGRIAEYWACRERLAVMDLSPLRKFEVLGPDSETLMQRSDHPERAQARRWPGRLHGAVQRDRRDDRRRDRVPARPGQLPVRRRRRVRRDLAPPGGRSPAPEGVDQAVHRPAPQRRGAGPAQPGGAGRVRVDPTVAAFAARS